MPPDLAAEKIDILMVDDRASNLLALEATLFHPEYNLIKAQSGDEALRYLLKHEPALILMDVQMPHLDGFQTAELIKQSERSRDIPIIFITAINKEERYAHKGYMKGAVDYIYKPYDPDVLRAKVAVFVDLHRKTKRLIAQEKLLLHGERLERETALAQLELRALKREQSEKRRYFELVAGIENGIVWAADTNSAVFSFVSSAAESLLGYPVERWLSEPNFFAEHLHPDDRARVLDCLERAKSTGRDAKVDHRFIRADGSFAWFHTGIRVGPSREGNGTELRGLSVDITQLKRSERITNEAKARSEFLSQASLLLADSLDYEAVLEHARALVIPRLADRLCIELTDSKSGEQRLFEGGDATGEELPRSEISVPLRVRSQTLGQMVLRRNAGREPFEEEETRLAHELALRIALALDNSALYRQAQTAIRNRDEFFSIASHELKTPLTPIKLHVQQISRLLEEKSAAEIPEAKLRKFLTTSDRQLRKLTTLVEELLDVSRLNSGKFSVHAEDFDFRALLTEVTERFADEASQAKCAIEIHGPERLPVRLDRFRIEQVIVNLLSNALKYGPGKPVRIDLEESSDSVKLSVFDQGIGIASEDQERIFSRFERAVPHHYYPGLGLGLYIVAEIIRIHGGRISVESTPGVGSRFTVHLPRVLTLNSLQLSSGVLFGMAARTSGAVTAPDDLRTAH